MNLRRQAIAKHQNLLVAGYEPAPEVFGGIEDGRPWWGLYGLYHGPGSRSIEGDAEESRFILNPFLLVGIHVHGKLHTVTGDDPRATVPFEEQMRSKNFPLYCKPTDLVWIPQQSRAEVKYDISGYVRGRSAFCLEPLAPCPATISLVAYNARDFGFNYLYLLPRDCDYVENDHQGVEPIKIKHFIHCGTSCGYPGSCCNNMSPSLIKLESITVTALPAKAQVSLWKSQPTSVLDQPDMTFVIHFE